MRYLSVCSGIEAASVAWEGLGWTPVGFAEIEAFPAEVLKQRYPKVPNYGDINGHEQWPLAAGDVDIIVGGPPCQAFSVAGLREGMADPRGNLSLVYFQIVSRLRPRWIVYENVPGLLSARGGQDFSSLLSALVECGYGFCYRTLDAANFGLAQRRKRVFIVGCRTGDWRHPTAVLFDGPSSFGHPKAGKKAGEEIADHAGTSIEESRGCWWDGGQISQTLDAVLQKGQTMPEKNRFPAVLQPVIADRASFNQGENALYNPFIGHTDTCPTIVAKGPHAVQAPIALSSMGDQSPHVATPMAVRRLLPEECEALQGFPRNHTRISWRGKSPEQCPDGPRYKAIGNSMATNCMKWIGKRIQLVDNYLRENNIDTK